MQARSAAARAAIAGYAARSAIPVRCSSIDTEKAIFARLNGRPNDDDMMEVLSTGMDKKFRDRWDCVRRNVTLPAADSVIMRNEVEDDADVEKSTRTPGKNVRLVANPRADILVDAKTACVADMTNKKKVYFFDELSVGVAKFARVKVDFVTDDAKVAKFLSQTLPRAPRSSTPRYFEPQSTGLLLHNSTKDEQAGGLDSYIMYDSKLVVARGVLPKLSPLLEVFANIAAQRLISSEVLVCKGDIRRDDKGIVSLVLGASDSSSKAAAGSELHGTSHAAFGANGITRLWEASFSERDDTISALPGSARSSLPTPGRIVFVVNKDGKSTKPIELEAAKKLFVEKFAVAPGEKTGPVFEKLVQGGKVELIVQE